MHKNVKSLKEKKKKNKDRKIQIDLTTIHSSLTFDNYFHTLIEVSQLQAEEFETQLYINVIRIHCYMSVSNCNSLRVVHICQQFKVHFFIISHTIISMFLRKLFTRR